MRTVWIAFTAILAVSLAGAAVPHVPGRARSGWSA
jgi:hypothetical protein